MGFYPGSFPVAVDFTQGLELGGVAVTSTAAELNLVDGVAAPAADGLGLFRVARATYDFAEHGGATGAIGAVLNPEGVPLIITDVKLYVDTHSTGAANLSVGIAANATTSDTDLINALAVGGAIDGKAYHGMTALAAKGEAQVWGVTEYITATGSASTAGFNGRLFIRYVRVNS